MAKSKGGSGKGQGRKSHWKKKAESRISVPYELADSKQKKALVEIWSLLEQEELDFPGLLTILKSGIFRLVISSERYPNKQPGCYRMYSTAVAASFGVISSSDADAGGYEEVSLNSLLVKEPERTIILEVIGDSMIDDGIEPDSILIVETRNTTNKSWLEPKNRDNVIALIDGTDLTVKKFLRTDKGDFLVPRNRNSRNHEPILIRGLDQDNDSHEVEILGIVKSVTNFF